MAQVRITRKEILDNPEKMKQAQEIILEFNEYLRDLKLPDIMAMTDFVRTYIQDMVDHPEDGLAEMRYTALARNFFHAYVSHMIQAQKMQEMIKDKLMDLMARQGLDMDSDEDEDTDVTEDKPVEKDSPFKNRKFLN